MKIAYYLHKQLKYHLLATTITLVENKIKILYYALNLTKDLQTKNTDYAEN